MSEISTKCLHEGYTPGNGEPRQLQIYQSTTFHYNDSDDMGKLFEGSNQRYRNFDFLCGLQID